MSDKKLWCIVEGDEDPFKASISQSKHIDDLRLLIFKLISQGVSHKDLVLWKPKETIPLEDPDNGEPDDNDLARRISNLGNFSQFAEKLNPIKKVGHYFGNQDGDSLTLSVIIQLPNSDTCDTCPMQAVPPEPEDELEKYKEIFVNARDWGKFCEEDIEDNDIHDYLPQQQYCVMSLPDFVTTFERILEKKPNLDPTWLESPISAPLRPYFELIGDSIADGMTTRRAELLEAAHTLFLTVWEWQKCWEGGPKRRRPLKEQLMNTMFFELLVDRLRPSHTSGMVSAQLNSPWPLKVVVKREDHRLGNNPQQKERLRQYTPRSDFLVSHATLPRLLVEVNSTSLNSNPPDLCRMLITGAYIVRFANNFVGAFQKKNFVLCAIFVWDDGRVARYTLFQLEKTQRVYYHVKLLSLDTPDGRVEFARLLYNLIYPHADQESETALAINQLNDKVNARRLESLNTKTNTRRASTNESGDSTGGGGGGDCARLREHSYEVISDVIVDDKGIEWESISKKPDNILTVYRRKDPDRELIAKIIREESAELKILKAMKHKHIIKLEDSFEGFAILPKMIPLQDVKLSQACESEVVEVCLGLIQGVAYLHQCNIAHRDIKPDNLVVDREFCLKIIDFDVAMQVKDENQEVDNSCGTKHWMAPEVEKKLRHSPIRADRWACGRVLQYLLGSGRTEGERPTIATLRPIADNLCAYVPKDRPSLPLLRLERSSSIPAGSNVIAGADVMTTEAREHAQVSSREEGRGRGKEGRGKEERKRKREEEEEE